MSANAPTWPSTCDTATSRSQSRASNMRIIPYATDRITRLSPPSAVPTTMSLVKLPVAAPMPTTRIATA